MRRGGKLRWPGGVIALVVLAVSCLSSVPAFAHVSEQGLVLLLPTRLYIISGTVAVALTLVIISVLPRSYVVGLFKARLRFRFFRLQDEGAISLLSALFLAGLVFIGLFGPRDPTQNLLPLMVWTVWWQGILIGQAVFGDIWHWINPWTGVYRALRGSLNRDGFFVLPNWLGSSPGILAFIGFSIFEFTNLAPDDPGRLAIFVGLYWLYTLAGMILFGARDWLARAECFAMLMRFFALLSMFALRRGVLFVGFPGWKLVRRQVPGVSAAAFGIMILATGSFDGVNETFWWLAKIGINPLMFPGRSAVVWQNFSGLMAADILLVLAFGLVVFIGWKMAKTTLPFAKVFASFALGILPIAVGYHFSHYLTAFMVNVQYTIAAMTDPFKSGADYLHLGTFYVTSGFLNSHDSVQAIWLSQAGAVVGGHMIAVLVSHYLAVKHFANARQAMLIQLPLAGFMIAYTVFGLWLLASPRGM